MWGDYSKRGPLGLNAKEGLRSSRSLCQYRQVVSQGGTLDKNAFLHLMESIVDPKKIVQAPNPGLSL